MRIVESAQPDRVLRIASMTARGENSRKPQPLIAAPKGRACRQAMSSVET